MKNRKKTPKLPRRGKADVIVGGIVPLILFSERTNICNEENWNIDFFAESEREPVALKFFM